MSIPLYLKIKGSVSGDPCFAVTSEKSIEFNDTNYDFEQIYQSSETQYPELINSHNSCIVLMGPTGGGKTTMMKQLVNAKLKSFDDEPVFVSSFEITNNKFLIDLLDSNTSSKIPFSLLNNFENKLKRKKASAELMRDVFKQRSIKATEFNANSSRSCLVITFFYHNFRTTFVDLMGNEKNSRFSSNIFANANVSSITQQMINKQKDVRSHNLVTNYIFKNKDLKVVLNLDQDGDVSLIKSTLINIADIVKTFKLSTATVEDKGKVRRTPSYTLPTMSSIRGSPRKVMQRANPANLKSAQPVRPLTRATVDRKYTVRKPPVPIRGPSKDAQLIEALKKEQILSKQKYADSIADIKTEIGYFKQETSQMVNTYLDLRSKLDLLARVNEEKQAMIVGAQEENARIVEQLSQVEQKVAAYDQAKIQQEEKTVQLEAELASLGQELVTSRYAVSELESIKTTLENKIELSKEEELKLLDRIRVLNIELDDNKKQLGCYDFDMTELHKKIDSQNDAIVVKEIELSELRSSKDELAKKNEALERELDSLKLSLEQATTSNNETSGEVKRLSSLIVEKDAEIERLQVLEQKLSDLKQAHQSESDSASSQLSNLKADISAKQIKIDYLRNTETTLNQQVQQLQEEKHVLDTKVQELTLSNQELQNQIDSAVNTGKTTELEAEISETRNQVNALSQELVTETSLNSQLKSGLEEAIAKQQALQSELANTISNLSKESNEKEDLTNKLVSKTQQLKTKIEAITQLEKAVNDSKEQCKQLQDRFNKKQEHYKTKISDLKKSHELVVAEKDAEIKKLKSSPTKLGLSDDYNGHLFSERSSPFGFNPNDIYNDSVVEPSVNLIQGNNSNLSVNKSDRKPPEKKSPNKKSHKSPDKQKSRSTTPNKQTPTKNILQPSHQFNSVPLSSGKIKKKSGSNKSSPLKSIKA
ncbi:hypothetical protein CORT_0D04960 [Candida orthopsilosis Co 90-125]|uniref:Kinesin motor domain-containing protein n=1 Tax=Candida orthopsilosis (strain 90-125) TaxID=1136231 RepID=H8X688_CANO9|nr:hypothetical protein CORT_0D04960 [Candida orthopsilosis Co 90-125]CCG23336.1 hypothetical protein CORT_0D04960 [Candida orthopsilosis Co 90-125]